MQIFFEINNGIHALGVGFLPNFKTDRLHFKTCLQYFRPILTAALKPRFFVSFLVWLGLG